MALTRIDLCSRALLKIGAQTITSFDDGTAEAEVAASLYSTVRDAALSAHPWNFATYQATLPKLASAPVADFANAFQLPVDCIRVLSAGTAGRGQGIRYKIKRRQLHTDADEVILTYISRPDELDFPPFFDMALIAQLAAEFCIPLTDSTSRWGRPSKTRRRGVPAGQADRCAGRNAAQRRRFHSAGRACVMPRVWAQKSNFSAGEISPNLLGRGDLRAYENGALRLRNVFIQPTGGVTRRHGFRFIDVGPGPGRLLAFEFNTEQVYLLLFSDQKVDVYRDGSRVADFEAPWTFDQLGQINWTQSADTLLVVHPDVPPKKITRTSESAWDLTDWSFHSKGDRLYWPHYKFAAPALTLQASGTTGSVHITASAPVFSPDHVGVRLRIGGKEVQISSVISAVVVQANVKESPLSTTATEDWTEQAFSAVRGWPVSVCFHQDRLVIGGSRDLPNRLWLSKSADLFNFDLGEGLDDEAIEFPILSDQVNAIRHVFSGRHLQVFTSGAEWMVTGDPLTPTSIQLFRQTRVGSPVDRTVPPRDVDGATIFVPRAGPQLRAFLFTDTEQAYQANDLAVLSHHLMNRPVDMSFDESRRLLHVVMASGTMATLTAYRDEQVSGWTLQETDGVIRSIATVGESTYALVERQGGAFVEVLDETLQLDCALAGISETPKQEWSGAGHLEGRVVKVVADGAVCPDALVEGGSITLDQPAQSVQMGLPFTHVIEPLPPSMQAIAAGQGGRLRPISITLRVWETSALYLDTGRGLVQVPFKRFGDSILDTPPRPFSGDVTVRTLGWRDTGIAPLWRIEQDVPLPLTLLSVSTELSVTG